MTEKMLIYGCRKKINTNKLFNTISQNRKAINVSREIYDQKYRQLILYKEFHGIKYDYYGGEYFNDYSFLIKMLKKEITEISNYIWKLKNIIKNNKSNEI